MLEVFSLPGF